MSLLAQLDLPKPAKAASVLSTELFDAYRALIYEKTGIYFQDNKQYLLESRVGQRLRALGMKSYDAYLHLVRNGGSYGELPNLLNAVTINETFFFRNPAQFEVLETEILPDLIERRRTDGTKKVRIWSAACSTGDEPYTLALLIRERIKPRYPYIDFEIVGTDVNSDVVDTARQGTYSNYAVRNIPTLYLSKYFRTEGDRYTIAPEIRRMVTFRRLNLFDRPGMMQMRRFDVIFCANVLIYFDTASKQQVIASLYNSMNEGGHLFVGFSETLYGITQSLKPVRFQKTIAYKKG